RLPVVGAGGWSGGGGAGLVPPSPPPHEAVRARRIEAATIRWRWDGIGLLRSEWREGPPTHAPSSPGSAHARAPIQRASGGRISGRGSSKVIPPKSHGAFHRGSRAKPPYDQRVTSPTSTRPSVWYRSTRTIRKSCAIASAT